METSDENIFVCGDCAEYNGMCYGIWPFAMASGKVCGNTVLGNKEAIKPQTLSTLYNGLNTKIFSTGAINFDDPNLHTVSCGQKESDYIKLFFDEDIMVGLS